jgi:signal transduction histidine kinase
VVALAEPEAVLIQVKDTGEGIAPEELPHIWERFYQVESARNSIDSGVGLGLPLVKELINEMGGSVSVESHVGEGSCFTLCLLLTVECCEEMVPQNQNSDNRETASESNSSRG